MLTFTVHVVQSLSFDKCSDHFLCEDHQKILFGACFCLCYESSPTLIVWDNRTKRAELD